MASLMPGFRLRTAMKPPMKAARVDEKLIQEALALVGPGGADYQKLQGIVASYRRLSGLSDANSRATCEKCESILRKVRLTGKLPGQLIG
jgi:hypothetical protein